MCTVPFLQAIISDTCLMVFTERRVSEGFRQYAQSQLFLEPLICSCLFSHGIRFCIVHTFCASTPHSILLSAFYFLLAKQTVNDFFCWHGLLSLWCVACVYVCVCVCICTPRVSFVQARCLPVKSKQE